jgi:hypothetical protein
MYDRMVPVLIVFVSSFKKILGKTRFASGVSLKFVKH